MGLVDFCEIDPWLSMIFHKKKAESMFGENGW